MWNVSECNEMKLINWLAEIHIAIGVMGTLSNREILRYCQYLHILTMYHLLTAKITTKFSFRFKRICSNGQHFHKILSRIFLHD